MYPLILAEMAGYFGHQKIVEQDHVLLLLFGRGDPPEATQTEARNVVDVHRRSNDCLQMVTLLLRRVRTVYDGHQPVTGLLDESDCLGACLRPGSVHRSWRRNQQGVRPD